MADLTGKNFGLLIAYLIPGFLVVSTFSKYSQTTRIWMGADLATAPTVGGFLYITLASIAAGLAVSTVRWLILDFVHHHTGIPRPAWDFSNLQPNLAAFEAAVENHFRYYQFYGNVLIALCLSVATGTASAFLDGLHPALATGLTACVLLLFFVASRDALQKYYARTGHILGTSRLSKEITDDERMAPKTEKWIEGQIDQGNKVASKTANCQ